MLIDKQGKVFNPDNLPRGRKAKEAALATLREVLVPGAPKGGMFRLDKRARIVEKRA